MSDRTLLYGANGQPVSRVLEGDEAVTALLVDVFAFIAGHPGAKPPSFLLQKLQDAVTVQKILDRFPDMESHIARATMRAKAIRDARNGKGSE